MSKKQLLVLSFFVAAIPAAGLLVKMLFSLLHLLADQSSASAVLWVVYTICLLGSAFIALLPLFLWLYYPADGYAMAGGPAVMQDSGTDSGASPAAVGGEDDAFEDAGGEEYSDEDDGEQLFDEDDMEAEDDEFDGGFDDDDDR